jgi:nucleoporin NUP42
MFKGRAVVYLPPAGGDSRKPIPMVRGPDGGVAKIWFPNGPPGYTRDTEAVDEGVYEKADTLASWKTFAETGRFADGVMPLVPPRREWCTWDF